jgi:phage/plasmid-like protein (TIGR03299 family)
MVNGRAEMFSGNGKVPWHKLGTVVQGLLSARDAIQAAHLDWTVATVPVTVFGREQRLEDWQGIIREDTGDCLGIMRGRYETIQNRDCFDFMDALVQDGSLKYETAGALRGGKQIWLMAKYDGEMQINGDEHRQWLLCVTSHDGSYSLMVQWITERVVCANTLSIALSGAKNQVKIRHAANWANKADEASRVLGLTKDYFGNIQTALAGMNDRLLSKNEMAEFTKLLVPAKDEKDPPTRTKNIREEINRLFQRGAGNDGASRWDALNAVTDYADHYATLRGDNSTRLESSLLGSGAQLKQKAFEYLTDDDLMSSLLNRAHKPSPSPVISGMDFARLLDRPL